MLLFKGDENCIMAYFYLKASIFIVGGSNKTGEKRMNCFSVLFYGFDNWKNERRLEETSKI